MLVALAFQFDSTSFSTRFHESFGVIIALLIVVHLTLNSSIWGEGLPQLFKPGMAVRKRVTYICDILMLISVLGVVIIGLYGALGPSQGVGTGTTWMSVHGLFAALTAVLAGVHLGLHWEFFTSAFKNLVKMPQTAGRVIAAVLVVIIVGAGVYGVATGFPSLFGSQPSQPQSTGRGQYFGPGGTLPSGFPTGGPGRGNRTAFPSGFPSGYTRPSGFPSGYTRPSGYPSGNMRPTGNRPSGYPTGIYTSGTGRQRTGSNGSGNRPAPVTVSQQNPFTSALLYLAIFGLFAAIVRGVLWLSRPAKPEQDLQVAPTDDAHQTGPDDQANTPSDNAPATSDPAD